MTSRTTLLAGASAVAAVLSLSAAAPAAADTAAFRDQRGDMGYGADIHRVRVVNDDVLRVRVTHQNLVRSYESGSSISVFLDTDRQRKGPELVFVGGTFEGADYALLRADGWKQAGRRAVDCGYAMQLDYAEDTATIRLDRDCLEGAGAVRVEVLTGNDLTVDGSGTARDWLGERREFSEWVPRG